MAKESKPGFSGIRDTSLSVARRSLGDLDLKGHNVAVVGGTNGLGRAITLALASRGARVTVVGQTFRDEGAAGIDFVRADLSLMSAATQLGDSLPAALDIVVLTTGIIAAPKREVTREGIERDMAVSFLSRLALLRTLAPRLPAGARVFVMGFPGTGETGDVADLNAERSYGAMKAHGNTVAGNEALVLDSARRYPNLDFFGLNPGLVKTGIHANYLGEGSFKHRLAEGLIGLFMSSADTYAARIVPVMVARELAGRSGAMFNRKGLAIRATEALTEAHVAALIAASERLISSRDSS
ncbi:MAG TPA: SDR family NAD(P)-dependent oxidoreductase [Dermatophilaceae bacterium]|nr:SDR family NAD(P)-dependent oxidoreductase [Dermatophilaceae bacterium]